VAGGAEASRAVDVHADVALAIHCRLTGVEAHAHPHGLPAGPVVGLERPLGGDCRLDRVPGPGERDEERIALRVDDVTAPCPARLPQQSSVDLQHLGVAVTQLLDQPRRPFDVREEERDGSAAELVRHWGSA
jgi:hypothetical protein